MSERLSAVIITCNAERDLPACLASVAFADEIIVVDSGSTDQTLAIAEHGGARVIRQEWLGYGAQKRFAAKQTRNRWVFSLDADERVSPALRASIQVALESPAHAAYAVPRCNRFMGRWLRHGEGYPDWTVRLFDRDRAEWSDDPVHEKVVVHGSTARLRGDLLHESEAGLGNYLEKQNRYTTLQAAALHTRGKRASATRMILSPFLRFIRFYVLRLGFLDGVPGFVHISIGCWNSFTKYAKLRALGSMRD